MPQPVAKVCACTPSDPFLKFKGLPDEEVVAELVGDAMIVGQTPSEENRREMELCREEVLSRLDQYRERIKEMEERENDARDAALEGDLED